jgi:hypothetical protein
MGHKQRRTLLAGLGAGVAAFGAAATTWAATAPTARADDFTDIVNAVDGDLAGGQSDFTAASADFSSGDFNDGLATFFSGVDEDLWAAPTNLEIGTVQALTGQPITSEIGVGIAAPADLANAESLALSLFSGGETDFSDAATALSSGDYVDAVYDYASGSLYTFDYPAELLIMGAVEALGL